MTLRFRISSAACFVFLLGVAAPLGAQQFVLYLAQVADGAGFFTEVSVNNPGSSAVACTFSTFDDAGQPLYCACRNGLGLIVFGAREAGSHESASEQQALYSSS